MGPKCWVKYDLTKVPYNHARASLSSMKKLHLQNIVHKFIDFIVT